MLKLHKQIKTVNKLRLKDVSLEQNCPVFVNQVAFRVYGNVVVL